MVIKNEQQDREKKHQIELLKLAVLKKYQEPFDPWSQLNQRSIVQPPTTHLSLIFASHCSISHHNGQQKSSHTSVTCATPFTCCLYHRIRAPIYKNNNNHINHNSLYHISSIKILLKPDVWRGLLLHQKVGLHKFLHHQVCRPSAVELYLSVP